MRPNPSSPRRPSAGAWTVVLLALLLAPSAVSGDDGPQFTRDFDLRRCTWAWNGSENRYFPLRGSLQAILAGEEEDDGELVDVQVEITVLRQTRRISFDLPGDGRVTAIARIVQEREWIDDELVEVSRNFFARCRQTGDVFYFGEEVDLYEDGEIVGHDGAWLAGRNGALPGIIMPGRFLLGSRYYQEVAPGVALDRGENVAMGLTFDTPAGTFHDCVLVIDTNELSPDSAGDEKTYCPGLGLVGDESLVLQEYGQVAAEEE